MGCFNWIEVLALNVLDESQLQHPGIGNILDDSVSTGGQGPQAAVFVIILMILLIIPMLYYLRSTQRAAEEA